MHDTEHFSDAGRRGRSTGSPVVARLIVTGPGHLSGRSIELRRGPALMGRNPSCDIQLLESTVSGRHAQIVTDGHGVSIEDLGSTNGTRVNGDMLPMRRPRRLRDGDMVTVASVDLAFSAVRSDVPNPRPSHEAATDPDAHVSNYHVDEQRAHVISNVGRDQHNSYATHNNVDLNPIPRSGVGRTLVGLGLILAFTGVAMFGYAVLDFIGSIFNVMNSADPFTAPQPQIKFMPWIPAGAALAVFGQALVIWGIFLSRAAKRRSRP